MGYEWYAVLFCEMSQSIHQEGAEKMSKRERDAFLRNRRPMIQTTIPAPKRTMPKKGIKVRILYDAADKELAFRAQATLVRWGYLCELVKDE